MTYADIRQGGGHMLYVADECDHVKWIPPGQLIDRTPLVCFSCEPCSVDQMTSTPKTTDVASDSVRSAGWTWRKVYVKA